MKIAHLAGVMAGAMAAAGAAQAQGLFDLTAPPVGKAANTLMVRVRAVGLIPLDSSSSITAIGGRVETTAQAAPEIDFSWFFTDNIAVELIAATTRHELAATGTAAGRVDVGSTWVLPPTLTVQYHFLPHAQISPYAGAGLNASFFYDTHAAGGTVNHVGMNNTWGPAIQAGVDYNVAGHWFANLDVKQIFANTAAHLNNGALKAKTALNPMVIGAGIGYRF